MRNETDLVDIGAGSFFGQDELVQQLTVEEV